MSSDDQTRLVPVVVLLVESVLKSTASVEENCSNDEFFACEGYGPTPHIDQHCVVYSSTDLVRTVEKTFSFHRDLTIENNAENSGSMMSSTVCGTDHRGNIHKMREGGGRRADQYARVHRRVECLFHSRLDHPHQAERSLPKRHLDLVQLDFRQCVDNSIHAMVPCRSNKIHVQLRCLEGILPNCRD